MEAPKAHAHQLVVDAFCAVFAAANGHFGVGDNVASIRALLVSGKAEELGSADDGPGAVGVLGSVADATSRPRVNSGLSERWRTECMGYKSELIRSGGLLGAQVRDVFLGRFMKLKGKLPSRPPGPCPVPCTARHDD